MPAAPPPPDAPGVPHGGPSVVPHNAPRLDGRRAHVLDRAAEYVRLADAGLTVSAIARRRRKSKGHVSILLRLGRALAGLPEDERAALRSPRVTWRLVQGLVRRDTDAASLRRQLRAAVGGFSTHNVAARDRAARAVHAARTPRTAPGPAAAPGVAWGWDAAWFARDPAGYAAAHLAHLTHLHGVVAARAEQAVRARRAQAAGALDTGQGLRALQRRLARLAPTAEGDGAGLSAAEREALALFATLGRALHAVGPSPVAAHVVAPQAGTPRARAAVGEPTARAGAAPARATGRSASADADLAEALAGELD